MLHAVPAGLFLLFIFMARQILLLHLTEALYQEVPVEAPLFRMTSLWQNGSVLMAAIARLPLQICQISVMTAQPLRNLNLKMEPTVVKSMDMLSQMAATPGRRVSS